VHRRVTRARISLNNAFLSRGVEDVGLLLSTLSIREDGAHASVLAGSTQRSGESPSSATRGWRCSTTWSGTGRSRSTTTGEPHGDNLQSDGRRDKSRCGVSASTSCGWSRARASRNKVARDAVPVVRVLDQTAGRARNSPSFGLSADVAETAIVYPGTVLGDGCRILDYAVVGKQPTLGPRSTTKQEDLPPLELGPGTIVSTGAIVFCRNARRCARDRRRPGVCVASAVTFGDDVVIGRGALVENDTTIGSLTKVQADAYITAYSTLEDEVFIAPRVITTNDNFMGRTEKAACAAKGSDDQAWRAHSARERSSARESRSVRRPSSGPAPSWSRTCPARCPWWGIPRESSATSP